MNEASPLVTNLPVQGAQNKAQDDSDKCSDVVVLGCAPVSYVELLQQGLQGQTLK